MLPMPLVRPSDDWNHTRAADRRYISPVPHVPPRATRKSPELGTTGSVLCPNLTRISLNVSLLLGPTGSVAALEGYAPYQPAVHSKALPSMSCSPHVFARFCPTGYSDGVGPGLVCLPATLPLVQLRKEVPNVERRHLVDRASRTASGVGRIRPHHRFPLRLGDLLPLHPELLADCHFVLTLVVIPACLALRRPHLEGPGRHPRELLSRRVLPHQPRDGRQRVDPDQAGAVQVAPGTGRGGIARRCPNVPRLAVPAGAPGHRSEFLLGPEGSTEANPLYVRCATYQSTAHSRTLPSLSCKPQAFACCKATRFSLPQIPQRNLAAALARYWFGFALHERDFIRGPIKPFRPTVASDGKAVRAPNSLGEPLASSGTSQSAVAEFRKAREVNADIQVVRRKC